MVVTEKSYEKVNVMSVVFADFDGNRKNHWHFNT